jgi:hypothetical protein
MEIKKMTAEMDYVPVDFQVRNLGGSYYEMLQNQNVTKEEGNDRVIYRSDTVLQTVNVTTRSEGIVAFIRMKYSQDNEFALINKGIINSLDIDYQNYRQYVVWCKEQTAIYFADLN